MKDVLNRSSEELYITRLAQCIRLYNAINHPCCYFPLPETTIQQFRQDLKEFGELLRVLEREIIEKHKLDPLTLKPLITSMYNEMNEADKAFMAGGSTIFANLHGFVDKFTEAVKLLTPLPSEPIKQLAPPKDIPLVVYADPQSWQSEVFGL